MGVSTTKYTLLVSLYNLPCIITSFFAGYLADLFGRRRALIACGSFIIIGELLLALGIAYRSFPLAAMGRFIYGMGSEPHSGKFNNKNSGVLRNFVALELPVPAHKPRPLHRGQETRRWRQQFGDTAHIQHNGGLTTGVLDRAGSGGTVSGDRHYLRALRTARHQAAVPVLLLWTRRHRRHPSVPLHLLVPRPLHGTVFRVLHCVLHNSQRDGADAFRLHGERGRTGSCNPVRNISSARCFPWWWVTCSSASSSTASNATVSSVSSGQT